MKIALVLSTPPGYSETFFYSKIKGLQKNGFEVTLFTQITREEFKLCAVKTAPKIYSNPVLQLVAMCAVYVSLIPNVVKLKRYVVLERQEKTTWTLLLKRIYLNAHLLKADADWLHYGFATQALGSEHVAKAIGAKMAVSFRGFDINVYPLKHPGCYQLLWKQVDKVHSISKYLLHQAHDLGLSIETPYQIITPAVADAVLEMESYNREQKKPLELLTISRLHWVKGIDLLIETAGVLKENGVDFLWKIIGDSDQKNTERYQYHIYEKGLQKHIQLLGKLTHEQTLIQLQQTDVYVQTSLNEGFCNAILEAQAFGKLCVATNVGGLSENISDTKTGWLVPKNKPLALANKIIEVCALPKSTQQQISQTAVSRVKAKFTTSEQQLKFVKFYQTEMCNQKDK